MLALALMLPVWAVAFALAVPTAASAASSPAVNDCNTHSRLTRHYSTSELRHALSTMPPIVQEYTDCYDVIQRALLTQLSGQRVKSGGSGSSSSGGSFLPVPLLIVLGLAILTAAGYAVAALRRRNAPGDDPRSGGPGPPPPSEP